jgi:hypothetical protein
MITVRKSLETPNVELCNTLITSISKFRKPLGRADAHRGNVGNSIALASAGTGSSTIDVSGNTTGDTGFRFGDGRGK